MDGLIPFERLSLEPVTEEILSLNELSLEHGLTLSRDEARELSETRNTALRENDRIEFGTQVLRKLVERFSASRYLDTASYADALNELTRCFYYIKAETGEKISDTALVEEMFRRFELFSRGDLDRFEAKEVERIIRKVNLAGEYERYYAEEDVFDPFSFGRQTPDSLLDDTVDEQPEDFSRAAGGAVEEIVRDEEPSLDPWEDFESEEGLGYANADEASLYDEVLDDEAAEDVGIREANGEQTGRSIPRRDPSFYFSRDKLTGKRPESEVESGDLKLPGGASLSVGEAYSEDFEGYSEDESGLLAALYGGKNEAEELDSLDAVFDRLAEEQRKGGKSNE